MKFRVTSCLFFIALSTPSTKIYAWTETHVETVHAKLEINSAAQAQIELTIRLRVRGGWLEDLEIAGLDPDFELDQNASEFISADGTRMHPRLKTRRARVHFQFSRRHAPRRGEYTAILRYHSDLSKRVIQNSNDDFVRVEWTLPPWRTGLNGVEIEIHAPPGAIFPKDEETPIGVEKEIEQGGTYSLLRWRRVHLPRTLPWTVKVDIPPSQMQLFTESRQREIYQPDIPSVDTQMTEKGYGPIVGVFLFFLYALCGFLFFERESKRRLLTPRPWISLSWYWRVLLLLLLAGIAAIYTWKQQWYFALGALALSLILIGQRSARQPIVQLGRFRPFHLTDLKNALQQKQRNSRSLHRFFDATTLQGLFLWIVGITVMISAQRFDENAGDHIPILWYCASLLFPLWVSTHRCFPYTPMERILKIHRIASRLKFRLPGPALTLVVHERADGMIQDARIRLITQTRPQGLLRSDIALSRDGNAVGLWLTLENSDAERIIKQKTTKKGSAGPGGRIVRILSIEESLTLTHAFEIKTDKSEELPIHHAQRARRRPAA